MRQALRRLFKAPAFSSTAIITLAVAIGANALIFSVVNGVLLKPLPLKDPDRLVGVWHVAPGVLPGPVNMGPSNYFAYRDDNRSFEDIGLWDDGSVTVTGRGAPEQVESLSVTDGTLSLLGVTPALGRFFSKQDDQPGGPATVILGYTYWRRVMNGDASAVGQQLLVNGTPHEIIGVLPERFRFLRYTPSVVLPFRFERAKIFLANFSYQGVARLKPGVTIEQANADIARIIPTLIDRFPLPPGLSRTMFEEAKLGPLVRPLEVDVVGDIGPTLWILMGTVAMVLIVACANVANLFLVRAEGRQQELAVRIALGAGRGRIARELFSESLLLSVIGGVVGLGLAQAGIRLLVYLQPARLPRLSEIALDPSVLLFTMVISVVAGLLFGAIPVLKYARPQLAHALKDSSRGSSEGRERHRARNTLVVAQVSFAVVLLVGSGLLIRTFMAMRNVPPGFVEPENVLTLRLTIPQAVVKDEIQTIRTHQQIAERLKQVPGVQSVGLTSSATMDGNNSNDPVFAEDFPRTDGKLPPLRRFKWIADGYFETMGNRIVAGRSLTFEDSLTLRQVAVISDSFARELWGEPQKAIGRRIRNSPSDPWREIVGVVGGERQDGVTVAAPSMVYWPALIQNFWGNPMFVQRRLVYVIRTNRLSDPKFMEEVQQAVWSVNSNLPLASVRTLQDLYDDSMAQTSFALVILGIAAAVTLLLGVVGIYGVIAYIVAQRRREVGIRMALGARAAEVQQMFISRGMAVTAIGLTVGLVAALGSTRLLTTVLFGVNAFDPMTYVAVVLGLGLVALVATWLPARQATAVDPAIALRGE